MAGQNLTRKEKHLERVIQSVLLFLNAETSNYILKGDTGLRQCYTLDRFSEDIDLDFRGGKQNIETILERYCKIHRYVLAKAKQTETTKRYYITYSPSADVKKLKVEVSLRLGNVPASQDEKNIINGISVYTISEIFRQKVEAYKDTDKIRDVYDLCYMTNHLTRELDAAAMRSARYAFSKKGIDHFDYLINDSDQTANNLIDLEKLANDFLSMFEKLGITLNEDERELLEEDIEKLKTDPPVSKEDLLLPSSNTVPLRRTTYPMHIAQTGKNAGQWVPCDAEIRCEFEGTEQFREFSSPKEAKHFATRENEKILEERFGKLPNSLRQV